MQNTLAQQAISFAITGKWKEAKKANLLILNKFPNDIDALNRLAKSYFELGNIKAAKTAINKVLKTDPYNPIAIKCYEKWKGVTKVNKNTSKQISPDLFLEEPGKTKIIHLIHMCDKPIIANLNCGDLVFGNAKSHRVLIVNDSNVYIGKLPDDVSTKLKKMMKLGYEYIFTIKSIDKNEIKIFIRETFRPDKYANTPSFSTEKIDYIPYTPPEMVHEKPVVSTFEEESESQPNPQFPESETIHGESDYSEGT